MSFIGEVNTVNIDQQLQYVASISHGKDSLKMLDVIFTRGLPLDRIVTSDIWATDTIRAELPEMVEFKDMADEYIWKKYHIEVEHLCAMKDGEKLTYEKLFYHVPKRKRERAEGSLVLGEVSRPCGARGAGESSNCSQCGLPNSVVSLVPTSAQEGSNRSIRGFAARHIPWCKKLKKPRLF